MKIFLLAGKARSGKNEVALRIKKYYDQKNEKTVITEYSKYIKLLAKEMTSWDGLTSSKPRKFLQEMGSFIRENLNMPNFFIDRMKQDIKIYEKFYDNIIISDVRYPEEIEQIKKEYPKSYSIYVKNGHGNSDLTKEEANHETERALDKYQAFDDILINDNKEILSQKVEEILKKKVGKSMNIKDLYINYFISKGHIQIPSAPLVPENDPSVLFNTAGMQPLIPYLMGEPHPSGTRLCDFQKCIRLTDLEEVGDTTHHTFFEMLGNWSLGDYFKKESIAYSYEFLTKVLKIPTERLAFTVFEGDDQIPRDSESAEYWKSHGISEKRIAFLGKEDNFWAAGETGPCGPDTEIFYWRSDDEVPEEFHPEDSRWVEIWNNVFMEWNRKEDGTVMYLPNKNVDTGMGYERIVSVMEGVNDNYTSSVWSNVIHCLEEITNLPYQGNEKSMRIIADHIRTSVFISSDNSGILPSNTDQGYILRRLIRRAIRHARNLNIEIASDWEKKLACIIIEQYESYYPELNKNKDKVLKVLEDEKNKFNRTLEKGLKEFEKVISKTKEIDGTTAFHLYDTYGFPIELTIELATEQEIPVDEKAFQEKMKEHQEKSRTASTGKFKGGLAGDSIMETKYHTATHLLNAALKEVLGKDTHQRGSNITESRMRFDFNCDHKLTEEEKKQVEKLVNQWILEDFSVSKESMPKEKALEMGAEAMFIEKYPETVTVYSIGNISKEICGGPHVTHTKELGVFQIQKEEASSAGIRRIKATLKNETKDSKE